MFPLSTSRYKVLGRVRCRKTRLLSALSVQLFVSKQYNYALVRRCRAAVAVEGYSLYANRSNYLTSLSYFTRLENVRMGYLWNGRAIQYYIILRKF